jgi:hypothetical protein
MLAEEFTIAWEIIKLRLAANMTQKQLAEKPEHPSLHRMIGVRSL